MSKITLNIKKENIETVLLILDNLKVGLIETIEVDKSVSKYKPTYKPKVNKVIKEGEAQSGKYMNPSSFKNRLNKDK